MKSMSHNAFNFFKATSFFTLSFFHNRKAIFYVDPFCQKQHGIPPCLHISKKLISFHVHQVGKFLKLPKLLRVVCKKSIILILQNACNQHAHSYKVITTRLILWAKQFMNIPTQEWGYLFFELQCHTTSMALEHI